LANKLQDLGYAVERKRDDFELAGVPSAVLKRFSRRTKEIEDKAAELGITDGNRHSIGSSAELVTQHRTHPANGGR